MSTEACGPRLNTTQGKLSGRGAISEGSARKVNHPVTGSQKAAQVSLRQGIKDSAVTGGKRKPEFTQLHWPSQACLWTRGSHWDAVGFVPVAVLQPTVKGSGGFLSQRLLHEPRQLTLQAPCVVRTTVKGTLRVTKSLPKKPADRVKQLLRKSFLVAFMG